VAPSWGACSLLNRFGETLLDSLIATNFDITLRPHPQSFISEKPLMERLQAKYPESKHFHWNRDADNFDILNVSDILISDFSGVLFDYAFVFGKPVIYVGGSPDIQMTDEAWLDDSNRTLVILTNLGKELKEVDIPSVGKMITELIGSDKYAASIKSTRDTYWQNQGHAAEAVADYLIKKSEELKRCDTKHQQALKHS